MRGRVIPVSSYYKAQSGNYSVNTCEWNQKIVMVPGAGVSLAMRPEDARDLAATLIEAADYCESQR